MTCSGLIQQRDFTQCIYTRATLHTLLPATGSYKLSGLHGNRTFLLACVSAVICTSHLGLPRHLNITDEHNFAGVVKRGIGGDINRLLCKDKQVAVIGMGSIAVECMRTSFETGAEHVTSVLNGNEKRIKTLYQMLHSNMRGTRPELTATPSN